MNKRPNNVDILLRVKMRAIPGAQSLESEEAGGGEDATGVLYTECLQGLGGSRDRL